MTVPECDGRSTINFPVVGKGHRVTALWSAIKGTRQIGLGAPVHGREGRDKEWERDAAPHDSDLDKDPATARRHCCNTITHPRWMFPNPPYTHTHSHTHTHTHTHTLQCAFLNNRNSIRGLPDALAAGSSEAMVKWEQRKRHTNMHTYLSHRKTSISAAWDFTTPIIFLPV